MKMTKNIQLFLLVGVVSLVFFVSCQNEENEVTPSNSETLSKTAPLTALLKRVAMTDPTADNIIDSTDCFKVKLPVEVVVNNQPVSVNSEDDYLVVKEIFDNSAAGYNTVDFVFPITVVYPDNTETVIGTSEQYYKLAHECQDVVPVDEQPVGCLKINYPITIFGYDSNFQIAETYVVNNDIEFLLLLSNMNVNEYYAIDYPFSLINSNGEIITIYSNDECTQAIEEAIANSGGETGETCEANSIPFTSVYDSIADIEGVQETTIWSAVTHEYTFSLDTDGVICSIGYQADMNGGAYVLEILEEDGTVLYSGIHTFLPNELKYVSITPVTVNANQKYIIKRRNPDGVGGGLCKALLRVEGTETILPITNNGLTIHSTRYYGGGTGSEEQLYNLIPFISFGFSSN